MKLTDISWLAMQELETGRITCSHKEDSGTNFVDQWIALWDSTLRWVLAVLHLLLRLALRSPALRTLLCFLGWHTQCASSELAPCNVHLRQTFLLPPRSCRHSNKLTVVLDLDETLVCAYDSQGLPPLLHSHAVRLGVQWFQLQCAAFDEKDGRLKMNNVIVYERPGLQEFLARASSFAEVIIFTAGLEAYASPLIDKIDPERTTTARLYRSATVVTTCTENKVNNVSYHVKDLAKLGRDLRRTVIVDNNPFSFILQPSNGIPCVPFTGDNPQDNELLEVLLPMLEHLAAQKDVRPFLDTKFQMASWFRSRGAPSFQP